MRRLHVSDFPTEENRRLGKSRKGTYKHYPVYLEWEKIGYLVKNIFADFYTYKEEIYFLFSAITQRGREIANNTSAKKYFTKKEAINDLKKSWLIVGEIKWH